MFRDVLECSGMFHVPGFIDARDRAHHFWDQDRLFKCDLIFN